MIKINIEDTRYPKILRNIKNAPKQLYLEGNIKLLDTHGIAIIGSRKCSENGSKMAKKFAQEFVSQNITIISGMANGIDTYAHMGALENKGNTIAVLGCGFNNIYPQKNEKLYKQIIKNNGLVVSEYPPETEASSEKFIERNRIVSGLSIGILVIEAKHRSGTSVTAKIAKSQNRKVFTIPHDLSDKYGIGTNRLIKKGASLITSTKDIIESFDFLEYKEELIKENKNKAEEKREPKEEKYRKIYRLINKGDNTPIKIAKKIGSSIKSINNILIMLEIEGYIKKEKGEYTCI